MLVDPDNVVDRDRFFEGQFDCALGDDGRHPGRRHLEAARGRGPPGAVRPDPGRCRLHGHRAARRGQPAPFRAWAEPVDRTRRGGRGEASGPRLHDHQPGEGRCPGADADPHPHAHPDPDGHAHADGDGPRAAGAADPVVVRRRRRRSSSPPTAPSCRLAVGAAHARRRRPPPRRPATPRRRAPSRRVTAARPGPMTDDRAVHAPRRLRVGTDADAQPADAAAAGPASAEADALVGSAGRCRRSPRAGVARRRSRRPGPTSTTAVGSSSAAAIASLNASANAGRQLAAGRARAGSKRQPLGRGQPGVHEHRDRGRAEHGADLPGRVVDAGAGAGLLDRAGCGSRSPSWAPRSSRCAMPSSAIGARISQRRGRRASSRGTVHSRTRTAGANPNAVRISRGWTRSVSVPIGRASRIDMTAIGTSSSADLVGLSPRTSWA